MEAALDTLLGTQVTQGTADPGLLDQLNRHGAEFALTDVQSLSKILYSYCQRCQRTQLHKGFVLSDAMIQSHLLEGLFQACRQWRHKVITKGE